MASGYQSPKTVQQATTGCPQARFDLPGLNLPLNWTPHDEYTKYSQPDRLAFPKQGDGKDLFPTALNDQSLTDGYCAMKLTTLREFTMLHIMNSLTDKPGWENKVFNNEISEKWKAEAINTPGADVTQAMMDWVIAELRWRSIKFKETGAIFVYNGAVIKSDTAIPLELKVALRNAIKPLEDVPETYKDYHPGSDRQVLDLVHPSLFPLIYGRSRVLEDRLIGIDDCIDNIGNGKTIQVRPDKEMALDRKKGGYSWSRQEETELPYSKNFQWLPCDVDISNGDAKITSYINNLHPQHHQDLYQIINQVISKTIPLWNMTLSGMGRFNSMERIKYELTFDPDPEDMSEEDGPQQEDGEEEDDYWDRRQEWENDIRKAVPCDPEEFSVPEDKKEAWRKEEVVDLVKDYAEHGLQIIVKLATIELTPEKPSYAGGSWHVEGQLNEHICATALYYYDNENISESHLAFRQHTSSDDADDLGYPQSVHGWLSEIYGVEQDGPTVQEVGSVLCKEDRLLTFPNILQHQVQSFKLADATKPGHRKILALFLVDPRIRIISTANVPPQQRDWWSERVNTLFSGKEEALGKLSNELKDKVFEEVDFPLGMDEAKEIRLHLMEERKSYGANAAGNFLKNVFSLCEH